METENPASSLLGTYWKQNSITMLCSDSQTHRSAFAVQLAVAIAEGSPIFGFDEMPEESKFVLYIDRYLTDIEFGNRYHTEASPLPEKFFHAALPNNEVITTWKGTSQTVFWKDYSHYSLRRVIEEKKPEVIVFDALDWMITHGAQTVDLIRLMNIFRSYVRSLGAGILVLAPPPPASAYSGTSWTPNRGIVELLKLADSVISLERSRVMPSTFYIKDLLKPPTYSEPQIVSVPLLGFEDFSGPNFIARHSEPEFIHNFKRPKHLSLLRLSIANDMYASGKTVSAIARHLGVSRTAVRKMLFLKQKNRISQMEKNVKSTMELLAKSSTQSSTPVMEDNNNSDSKLYVTII